MLSSAVHWRAPDDGSSPAARPGRLLRLALIVDAALVAMAALLAIALLIVAWP